MLRISTFFSGRRASRVCLFLAAALAGMGLGRLGRHHFARPAVTTRTASDSAGFFQSNHDGSAPAGGKAGHAPTAREALSLTEAASARLALIKGADYWLYLLAAAENAAPDRLAGLMDSLGRDPSAAIILGRRWAQRDPAGMLAYLKSHPFSKDEVYVPSGARGQQNRILSQLQKILAQEWLRKDPEGLIAALNSREVKASGESGLIPMKIETVRLLVSTDPGRTLDLMLAWQLPLDSVDGPALVS